MDELDKIALVHSLSAQAVGKTLGSHVPRVVKPPIKDLALKPKAITPTLRQGTSTNYSRVNAKAPGTNTGVSVGAKMAPPPPIR